MFTTSPAGSTCGSKITGGQPHDRAGGRDPGVETGVQARHGLEAQAMASGDIQQRVVRLDEVGLDRAERRAQGGIDVELGPARRGRRDRPDREQAGGEREQGASRGARWWRSRPRCSPAASPCPAAPPPADPPALLDAAIPLANDPTCPRIAHIEVRKRERRLVARCDPGPAVVMKVALGRQPVGAKTSRGDHRTPEGSYVVSGPAQRNRFHRFIPIDYPSRRDADAALAARRDLGARARAHPRTARARSPAAAGYRSRRWTRPTWGRHALARRVGGARLDVRLHRRPRPRDRLPRPAGECSQDDPVLPGVREDIRAVLQNDTGPVEGENGPVANTARRIALGAAQANANWTHATGTPATRVGHAALGTTPQLACKARISAQATAASSGSPPPPSWPMGGSSRWTQDRRSRPPRPAGRPCGRATSAPMRRRRLCHRRRSGRVGRYA